MSEINNKNKALPTEVNSWLRHSLMLFGLFTLMCVASLGVQAATFSVSTLADNGAGSLRDAITQANAAPGFDTITFSLSGTISLVTPLPAITDEVSITKPANAGAVRDIVLDGSGTTGAGNASIGLYIRAGNTIIKGLAINGFGEAGIRMDTDGIGTDNGNTISGNHIGTNNAGTTAIPNLNRGILIVGTTGHTIGGSIASDRNVISGNSGRGIDINAGGNANIIGNYIGTRATGANDLGNLSHGIQIVNSSGSTIGGGTNATRNTISGNNGSGVTIIGDIGSPASNNIVQGNYIGVNSTGNTALPNNGSGVLVQGSANTVGGTTTGARNVISGNFGNGVSINSSLSTGNTVSGNFIGVGANGTASLPNSLNGVQISNLANGNTVGGSSVTSGACDLSCNTIANNGDVAAFTARAGVYVDTTAGIGNAIRRNSIFGNFGIGIDIGTSGRTANDAGDADSGANGLQNFPVLTAANDAGLIQGTLDSTASTGFTIDFFRNAQTDGAATSEGRTFIGSTSATTNGAGAAAISFVTTATLTVGEFITATATQTSSGSTSEFSDTTTVVLATGGVSISGTITEGGSPLPGATVTLSGDVSSSTTTDASGDYSFTGLPAGGNYLVTPSLTNYTFNPTSRPYNNLTANVTDADFVGTQTAIISISGTILKAASPLAGATVTLSGASTGSTTTDANGDYSFTGLASGSYVVTPTLASHTFSPTNRSYSNISADVANADFEAFEVGQNPRIIRVVNTIGTPTQPVTVPVQIDSQGDETGFTFSFSYDTAILSSPVVNCGADAGNCTLVTNTTVAGQIGVNVDPENPFTPGTRELINITFNIAATTAVNTPVNFTDTPATRQTSDENANGLPTTYEDGLVVFPQGLESDVAPRPNGDDLVAATDVLQVRRFAVGLDTYSTTANEFQRADAAPIGTLGDGLVASTDVIQARRYQVGLDPAQGVGGPTGPNPLVGKSEIEKGKLGIGSAIEVKDSKNNLLPRVIRVIDKDTTAGSQVTVSLETDAEGDESNYNFSIGYDSTLLSNPLVTIGSGATGGNVLPNTNTAGQIGFQVDFNGGTIPAGDNRQLVTVRFDVAANAPAGMTPLTFQDAPAPRQTSNTTAQPLATTYVDGNVNILATTTGSVRVKDRNTSPGQQVTVSLLANSIGVESNYGFSLNYDTAILSNPVVQIGNDARTDTNQQGNVLPNTNVAGRIGFSVDFNFSEIQQGNDLQLVTITFDVSPGAPQGLTPLIFGDNPAARQVSNTAAQVVPTNFIDGNVNILGPTAASVTVSGRVTLGESRSISNASVILTNTRNGEVMSARTNSFGYFRIDQVDAGETYLIDVESKGYSFTPQTINVDDNVSGLKLIVGSQ